MRGRGDEFDLAVNVPAPATSAEDVAAPAVRDAMLSGRFVGSRDAALADAAHRVPRRTIRAMRIDQWFGAERGARLRIDAQALRDALDRDIAAIDAMLSEQLDAILHHARLRKLEGTWRGLAWLVDGVELSNRLKIKILNVGWPEICRDLERAIEFDQSQLFRKIYEEEFGTPGGEPTACWSSITRCVIAPASDSRTDDVSALMALSGVAAAAFSPVIIGASPALLEVDSFADLATSTDLAAPLRNAEHDALAQSGVARRHALRRSRAAARAGAPALAGRRHARRRLPLQRICAHQRTACLDERRLRLRLGGRARLRPIRLARRCARRGDRSRRRRSRHRRAAGTVQHRSRPRLGAHSGRDRADRSPGALAARCRADAAFAQFPTARNWCSARCAACRCRSAIRVPTPTRPTPMRGFRRRSTRSCAPRASRIS